MPRQAFERRLQEHYSNPLPADADPTWYSLRNTVFAIGSRLALGRGGGPSHYAAAQRQSWLYFENALAAHTNLVYMPSDITAVECVTLMISCHSPDPRRCSTNQVYTHCNVRQSQLLRWSICCYQPQSDSPSPNDFISNLHPLVLSPNLRKKLEIGCCGCYTCSTNMLLVDQVDLL